MYGTFAPCTQMLSETLPGEVFKVPITATQIVDLRNIQEDFEGTERLKNMFQYLRNNRQPFFLNEDEFDNVLRWKLRGQYGRGKVIRAVNTDKIIRSVTGLALTITNDDYEYELELRLSILCSLRGVAVAVASAILALTYPERYAVIDFRVWRQLYDHEHKNSTFSIVEYKQYMQKINKLAQELGWFPQEVDAAIWEYDRRYGWFVPEAG